MKGSFQQRAPRKTAKHTVKHRNGGVGSVVANHCGGGERSVVVTTLAVITSAVSVETSLFQQSEFANLWSQLPLKSKFGLGS